MTTTMRTKPSSADVGALYDRMSYFYDTLWNGNIHCGIWDGPNDTTPMAAAQDRLTDMVIARSHAVASAHLLDVGSGTGRPALRLVQATGCRLTGVTVSPLQQRESTERAAREGLAERVTFVCTDAMQMPFADGTFDGAWAIESLLHVEDREHVLRHLARVVRPGGRLVIAEVTNEVMLTPDEEALFYPALGVSSLLSAAEYPAVLERNGFTVLESLDLRNEIENTVTHTIDLLSNHRDELVEKYDADFVSTLERAWVTIGGIHVAKMGYVLLTAERRQ